MPVIVEEEKKADAPSGCDEKVELINTESKEVKNNDLFAIRAWACKSVNT